MLVTNIDTKSRGYFQTINWTHCYIGVTIENVITILPIIFVQLSPWIITLFGSLIIIASPISAIRILIRDNRNHLYHHTRHIIGPYRFISTTFLIVRITNSTSYFQPIFYLVVKYSPTIRILYVAG